jgi:hypothetical protein
MIAAIQKTGHEIILLYLIGKTDDAIIIMHAAYVRRKGKKTLYS